MSKKVEVIINDVMRIEVEVKNTDRGDLIGVLDIIKEEYGFKDIDINLTDSLEIDIEDGSVINVYYSYIQVQIFQADSAKGLRLLYINNLFDINNYPKHLKIRFDGYVPIEFAISRGKFNVAKELIFLGANLKLDDLLCTTLRHHNLFDKTKYTELLKLLRDNGVCINEGMQKRYQNLKKFPVDKLEYPESEKLEIFKEIFL